jgi:hypothetical protein
MFDPNRPCNGKTKLKNRYTRTELEKIASQYNIENIKKKTMDILCNELNNIYNKKKDDVININQDHSKKECELDPNRPCNTTTRAKNRYTRTELDILAKKCNIINYKKKTITDLCDLLKKKHTTKTNNKVIPKPNGSNNKTKSDKIIQKKKCNPKSEYAFRPNYKCDEKTGKWVKINQHVEYFFRYELENMTLEELKNHAKKLHIKNSEHIHNKNVIIKMILNTQYPLVKNPIESNKYIDKFKSYLSNLVLMKKKIKEFKDKKSIRLIQPIGVIKSLTYNLKNDITYNNRYRTFYGYYDLPKNSIKCDLYGLYQNKEWFIQQAEYQNNLPLNDKLMILCYTYTGDAILHAWLDGLFTIAKVLEKSYIAQICPLYPPLIQLCTIEKNGYNYFMNGFKPDCGFDEKMKKDLFERCKTHLHYSEVFRLIFQYKKMTDQFYNHLVSIYYNRLNYIILHSPPLSEKLTVYKGTKTYDFLDFTQNNIYKNKRFISTSLNSNVSLNGSFVNIHSKCCLQKITLLRHTKCLFLIYSYYSESEILLPTNRHIYKLSNQFKPLKGQSQYDVLNVIVAN